MLGSCSWVFFEPPDSAYALHSLRYVVRFFSVGLLRSEPRLDFLPQTDPEPLLESAVDNVERVRR